MTPKWNSKPVWSCALSTFILAGTVRAQGSPAQPPRPPQPYLAHISIHAAPSTELEIVPSEGWMGPKAVARCTEYCDFRALPGRYTLHARNHRTGKQKDLSFRIKQSTRFELQAGDEAARTAGLAVGIAGSAAILAGFVLLMPAVFSQMCEDTSCTSDAERDAARVGLGLLFAGALTTPVGWTIYASNRTRLKQVDERSSPAAEPLRQVRVGVFGLGLGGLGFGGVASF